MFRQIWERNLSPSSISLIEAAVLFWEVEVEAKALKVKFQGIPIKRDLTKESQKRRRHGFRDLC